uniref:Uncharacterized protein n=1 Tax=Anguilla anguilla TaxID=7936 RepID=A0A0E9SW10_ANGAN
MSRFRVRRSRVLSNIMSDIGHSSKY